MSNKVNVFIDALQTVSSPIKTIVLSLATLLKPDLVEPVPSPLDRDWLDYNICLEMRRLGERRTQIAQPELCWLLLANEYMVWSLPRGYNSTDSFADAPA